VPTLAPTVFANRFSSGTRTAWTLLNGGFRTFRGSVLRVPHREGARYVDAFTGQELAVTLEGGMATVAVELGPKGVGCVVAATQ
jgi:gamma-glutamyl hercynylcysteine S-oxide synthase